MMSRFHTLSNFGLNFNYFVMPRPYSTEAALNRMVPESWNGTMFDHVDEGPDDMAGLSHGIRHAHVSDNACL